MSRHRPWIAAACLLLGIAAGTAHAQSDYPNRPVRIIVDSAPGSATDTILRLMNERLGQLWGQQVLALNHPGGGGSIAARVAAGAAPDGYTLYLTNASVFTAVPGGPGVAPNLPLELPRDFLPIGFVALQPMFIAAAPSSGIATLADLIARAKEKPGELSYATTGRGRITHMTMELLQGRAGIKLQMVPYAGGPAQALNDVMSGRVPLIIEGYSGLAGGLQSGIIKGVAVAHPQRLPEFPDLPAVAETLPDFQAGGWNVLVAPVGTPEPIQRKVAVDLEKVLKESDFAGKLAPLGAYPVPMSPEQVAAFIRTEQQTWRPVAEQVIRQGP
jgi:tripartite-type tricarboxylate transporter receptor subunit TctC